MLKRIARFLPVLPAAAVLLTGCREFKFPGFGHKGELLARVGKAELFREDLGNLFTNDMSSEDSVKLLKAYVEGWVKTRLKLQKAEELFREDQADLEKQLEEYRNSLLLYKYEQQFVGRSVDTVVTQAQINDYYMENKDRYRLAGPLVKARVVRIPADFRQEKKLRELFRSSREEDYLDFADLVEKNGFKYDDFSTQWTDLSTVLQTIPYSFKERSDGGQLKEKRFYEVSDRDYRYMMKILDYKDTGEYAPVETVRDVIAKVILNQRRYDLIRSVEDSLYRTELDANNITVNID